jgi:GAF domain-containing protein
MANPELFEKKFSILQEITNTIIITENINALSNLILDLAMNYTDAEKGSLMLLNKRGELSIFAARGIDNELVSTYRVKKGEGVAGTVVESQQPFLVDDIEKHEAFKGKKRDRYRTKSFISCPIIIKNKVLGVLNMNDKKDGSTFSEDEFELIKVITNHAAIAFENAFLMNQLRTKTAELDEVNKRLIESDIAKSEFLTLLSHDMRTPLNSIKGAVYYLQQTENLTTSAQKEFHDIISKETVNLTSTVENLIDFLRIEDETKILKQYPINLNSQLKELSALKSFQKILTRKNLKLLVDIPDDLTDIIGDRIRVTQFFINLIEAISHYLESGDTISITAGENDFVQLGISFSRKMPTHILSHLSNVRRILNGEKPEELVKLFIAQKIAEMHKWDLTAENTEDNFRITLKISKSTKQKAEAFINTTMDLFVEFVSELLNLEVCSIMLADEFTAELTINSARGLDEHIIKGTRIRFGDQIAGWVAMEGKPLLIEDIENDPHFGRRNIPHYNTKSLLSVPLMNNDKVIGVMNMSDKRTNQPFTERDLHIASMISERISFILKRLHTGEFSDDNLKHFISSLDNIIGIEKVSHQKKNLVFDLMHQIMDKLGTSEHEKKTALYISLLYDIGLSVLNDAVLKKRELTTLEVRSVRSHPLTTIDLIRDFEFSEEVNKAIMHHHERYDGGGYPDGIKGEEIPFISRVLAVVDSYCSMIDERPYRKAYTKDEALQDMKKGAGSLYDPRVVAALEEVLKK